MSIFNSKSNRITIKGYLITHVEAEPNNEKAVTFKVKVSRPHEVGKEEKYDIFDIYVVDKANINACKTNLARGMSVSIKGEMRQWYNGTWRLCVREIQPIW